MMLYDEMLYYLRENGIYYIMDIVKHKQLYVMGKVIKGHGVSPDELYGAYEMSTYEMSTYEVSTKTAVKLCKLIGCL